MEAVAHVLDDPQATRRAGAYALEAGVGRTLKAALRAFGSPELAYTNVARSNQKFSRNSRMEVLMVGNGYATLSHRQVVDVRNTKVDCLYNQGLLGVLPELFGLAPARVTHTQCALDGADACVYDVRWERRSRMARWSPTVTVAGATAPAARRSRHPCCRWLRAARGWRWPARRRGPARRAAAQPPPTDLEAELDTGCDRPNRCAGRCASWPGELDLDSADDLDRRRRAQGRGRRRARWCWRRTARWWCSAPAASAPRPSGRWRTGSRAGRRAARGAGDRTTWTHRRRWRRCWRAAAVDLAVLARRWPAWPARAGCWCCSRAPATPSCPRTWTGSRPTPPRRAWP